MTYELSKKFHGVGIGPLSKILAVNCLLYTADAADDLTRVDLSGRRIIKKIKTGELGINVPYQ